MIIPNVTITSQYDSHVNIANYNLPVSSINLCTTSNTFSLISIPRSADPYSNNSHEISVIVSSLSNCERHIDHAMKVSGALVGIALNPSERKTFFLIAPELTRLAREAEDMTGYSPSFRVSHNALSPTLS